jgi:hypothetical protein
MIQCATCINGSEMYKVDDDMHIINEVTRNIQRWARIYECPSYFALFEGKHDR